MNCWQVVGGGVGHKVLFRVGWKHILGIPGFENMSHGNTLCCKSRMESYFSLVL